MRQNNRETGEDSGAPVRILGITGNVGCGKSTMLDYMHRRWNARILELDRVAAELQKKGAPCYGPMLKLLGEDVLSPDREFDRARVAEKVFSDKALLDGINKIVHPAVREYVERVISGMGAERTEDTPEDRRLLVIEAALLYEGRYELICDEIWYIHTDAQVRAARLKESRGYTDEKIQAIMAAQKDEAYFRERADAVIDNTGDDRSSAFEQIDRQMERFLCYHTKREER